MAGAATHDSRRRWMNQAELRATASGRQMWFVRDEVEHRDGNAKLVEFPSYTNPLYSWTFSQIQNQITNQDCDHASTIYF